MCELSVLLLLRKHCLSRCTVLVPGIADYIKDSTIHDTKQTGVQLHSFC